MRSRNAKYVYNWRLKHPERQRFVAWKSRLKRKFNLTPEEYVSILKSQKFKCAICFNNDPSGRRLAVDHDHKTGKIRGLLCINCNRALGYFKDDTKRMGSAVKYLRINF